VRWHKALLDRDLAELDGVKAIALRKQVRRNLARFPDDFMFHTRNWDWPRSGRSVPVPVFETASLPARVVRLPGESLVSMVRRTATAMGYEGPHRLRALIVDAGKVQANVNVLRSGPILDILAVLLRQRVDTVSRYP